MEGGTMEENRSIAAETRILAALLASSLVKDCAVLCRRKADGGHCWVAYIVPDGPLNVERLCAYANSVLPGELAPAFFVPLFSLPRDAQGMVDTAALLSQEVHDPDLLLRWEQQLRAQADIKQAAVMLEAAAEVRPPLHISDLCAELSLNSVPQLASESSSVEPSPCEQAPSAMALSDGGPLVIPEGSPKTLSEALQRTAIQSGDRGITFIQRNGSEVLLSYRNLLNDAKVVLAGLRAGGLKAHDRVILQLDSLREHFTTFWACVLGGITPVTVAIAPTYNEVNGVVGKLHNTWKLLEHPVILASNSMMEPIEGLKKILPMPDLKLLAVSDLTTFAPDDNTYESRPEDLVFFQLTSGSTGMPKCIQETHRGIIAHIHSAQQFNGYTPNDVDLNWLPVDHVVPILTCHLKDVYLSCSQVHIKTDVVLSEPTKWLDYIEKHRATHSWSPNFGFKLLTDALAKTAGRHWDLGSMKFFMNAGEQVTLPVVSAFLKALAPFGVAPQAMQPAFGMAEVCTCMTYQNTFDVESGVHRVTKTSLSTTLKEAKRDDRDVITFVDLGPPTPGVQIRITDQQNKLLPERVIGRLQIKGDVVTPGYLNNESANREAFVGEGWFNSGDLGFIANGRLTLTGREKEMIIVRGANFYCYEIEDVVNQLEGVEPTFVAACGVADPSSGSEGLAIFFVPALDAEIVALIKTIRTRVASAMGLTPMHVIPMARKDFPKTTSGKIQRSQLKKALEAGSYAEVIKKLDIQLGNSNTVPDWFMRQVWRQKQTGPEVLEARHSRCLIFLDSLGLGAQLRQLLEQRGMSCISVEQGTSFAEISKARYRIDPKNPAHYRQVLEQSPQPVDLVLHLWTYDSFVDENNIETVEAGQDCGIRSVLALVQALARRPAAAARLYVLSSYAKPIATEDKVVPTRAMLFGFLKSIPQELPWLKCCHIDSPVEDQAALSAVVLRELNLIASDVDVAYRDCRRMVPRLERVDLLRQPNQPAPFKNGGLYLLSGGLGGIGGELARHLLQKYGAKLLLVGRTQLPSRDTWAQHLKDDDTLSQRVRLLSELEKLPGSIRYETADVADALQMQEIVAAARQRWSCELDGVIHLAGTFVERPLVEETWDSFGAVLKAKVTGTLILHDLIKQNKNAFLLCFSSANSIFGGALVSAYAAANSFVDGFARSHQRAYCYAWSQWDDIGMSRGYQLKSVSRARGYCAIGVRQGIASLFAAFAHAQHELVIGLDIENERIRQHLECENIAMQRMCAYFSTASGRDGCEMLGTLDLRDAFGTRSVCRFQHLKSLPLTANGDVNREKLSRAGRESRERSAPQTEIEKQIAAVWHEAFGVSDLALEDNFFELGGHSLLAAQIANRMQNLFNVELPLRSLFEAPTIKGMAAKVARQKQLDRPAPAPAQIVKDDASRHEPFPLTDIQHAYWLGRTDAFELGSVPCQIYVELDFQDLNLERLNSAVERLIDRHPMLWSAILPYGTQRVLPRARPWQVEVIDLRGNDPQAVSAKLAAMREALSHQVLPADQAPLFRIQATQMDGKTRLHCNLDMMIADARSLQIMAEELSAFYEDGDAVLPPLDLTFRDYVFAVATLRETEAWRRAQQYWLERLPELPLAPDLPTAKSPAAIKHPRFVRRSIRLNAAAWSRLKARAAQAGITPSDVVLGAFAETLALWSKNSRFTLNLTLFNRLPLHPQVNQLVGDFTSSDLLTVDASQPGCFETRTRRLQEQLWEDLDHRLFSGVRVLQEWTRVRGGPAPMMPIVFTSALDLPGSSDSTPALLRAGRVAYSISQTPQVWLDHHVFQNAGELICNWDAIDELFPQGLLDDMFAAYGKLLASLAEEDDCWRATRSEIRHRLFPDRQLKQRAELNATEAPVPDGLLHSGFLEQVALRPHQTAVVSSSKTLTYGELDQRSTSLGRKLRSLGSGRNELVAVVLEKGWEQPIAVLAVLKSGAAYLPIDPALPRERLWYLLEHGMCRRVLTTTRLDSQLAWPDGVERLCVDDESAPAVLSEPLEPVQKQEDLAYVIYTSGSTGLPKGVAIDHRGALNTIVDINQRFAVGSGDRVLALSALNFDLSVYDIFGTLAAGGTIVIPDADKLRNPGHWANWVAQAGVTIWNSVPALAQLLVDHVETHAIELTSLRVVMMSGDWIPVALPDRIRALLPEAKVISLGGATEASIWSILYPIEEVDPNWKSIPYGRPMLNQRFHVLDSQMEPVPMWVAGDLYIGGVGLAKGYWRDEEKTRNSFVVHPKTGERLYRTGDLGRYLPDGNIEFLGRDDFQVKVNGHRIELGEIESALLSYPGVRAALAVAAGERSGKWLAAYIEADTAIEKTELQKFLRQKLPEYMIPLNFVPLRALPLTANGKVDRRMLPPPTGAEIATAPPGLAPRNAVEHVLVFFLTELLGIADIGVCDNFFNLGGNSLLAIQMISRIRDAFRVELDIASVFDATTIAHLSELLLSDPATAGQIQQTAEELLGANTDPVLTLQTAGEAAATSLEQWSL
jgi:amino acid adenylation domain-containing protein